MKRPVKNAILVAFASPVLFGSACTTGLREALIESGFAFVEHTGVEVLQAFIPVEDILEDLAGGGEE